jgi:hypothetical protein
MVGSSAVDSRFRLHQPIPTRRSCGYCHSPASDLSLRAGSAAVLEGDIACHYKDSTIGTDADIGYIAGRTCAAGFWTPANRLQA